MPPTVPGNPRTAPYALPPSEPPAGTSPGQDDPRRGVKATWTYTLGSMVLAIVVLDAFLASMAAQSLSDSGRFLQVLAILLILASAALHVRYCWFLKAGLRGGLPDTPWTVTLLAVSAASWILGLLTPVQGFLPALQLWMAISLVACLLPKWQRWTLLAAGLLLVLAHPVVAGLLAGQPSTMPRNLGLEAQSLVFYSAALPFVLLSSLWWWGIVVQLDGHRQLAGELAVAKERLRFAADLHDIQGHHLQVIALKSELAERLLTIDVAAAAEHVHETRVIAKQALEETRSLVSGYREIALGNELENAREVLAAAGADCTLSLDPLPSATVLHRALAMTVREGTTNILRHSNATRASITLRSDAVGCTLAISNNGLADSPHPGRSTGSGLAGLRGRVEALGGHLVAGAEAGRFELRVWVPTTGGTTK